MGMEVKSVNLSVEDWQHLDKLAGLMARSRSDTLRQLIRRDKRAEELVVAYRDGLITASELAYQLTGEVYDIPAR